MRASGRPTPCSPDGCGTDSGYVGVCAQVQGRPRPARVRRWLLWSRDSRRSVEAKGYEVVQYVGDATSVSPTILLLDGEAAVFQIFDDDFLHAGDGVEEG